MAEQKSGFQIHSSEEEEEIERQHMPTNDEKQTTLRVSEEEIEPVQQQHTPTNDEKRRTPRVSSAQGRLQTLTEEGHRSYTNTNLARSRLGTLEQESRQRSQSEPLSLEASKVAKELQRLSDALNFYYKALKRDKVRGRRRHTVGDADADVGTAAGGGGNNRRTFHFDYDNYYDDVDGGGGGGEEGSSNATSL